MTESTLPEPPRHRLYITTDDSTTERFVTSAHPDIPDLLAHYDHTIVRCGVCGHDTLDYGSMRSHAWMGHEHHFESRHVGTKVVWRAEDVADETLAALSEMSRYRWRDDTPEPVAVYRGDTPDAHLRDRTDADDLYVVVHQPPGEAYPDSPEADATEAMYLLPGASDD